MWDTITLKIWDLPTQNSLGIAKGSILYIIPEEWGGKGEIEEKMGVINVISPKQNIPCNKVFPTEYRVVPHFAPIALPNAHNTIQQPSKPSREEIH